MVNAYSVHFVRESIIDSHHRAIQIAMLNNAIASENDRIICNNFQVAPTEKHRKIHNKKNKSHKMSCKDNSNATDSIDHVIEKIIDEKYQKSIKSRKNITR